jgi:hypothetical protein
MPSTVNPEDAKIQACPLLFQEAVLVQFLFEDEASIRPLDKVTDPDLLDEIAPVRSFVEKALTGSSCEELDVIFWKAEDGALKMTLRGPDDVVSVAKSLIGDRTAIPPTQH